MRALHRTSAVPLRPGAARPRSVWGPLAQTPARVELRKQRGKESRISRRECACILTSSWRSQRGVTMDLNQHKGKILIGGGALALLVVVLLTALTTAYVLAPGGWGAKQRGRTAAGKDACRSPGRMRPARIDARRPGEDNGAGQRRAIRAGGGGGSLQGGREQELRFDAREFPAWAVALAEQARRGSL